MKEVRQERLGLIFLSVVIISALIYIGNNLSFTVVRQKAAIVGAGSNLVAHFTFDDGTATDSSGNGNNATVGGAAVTSGKVGSGALLFDGVDDYVQFNTPANLNFINNYSVSFWIKPNAGFSGTIFRLSNSTSNTIARSKYEIRVNGTSVSFTTGDGTTADTDIFSTSLSADTWAFITCIHGADNSKSCYKNGSLISSAQNDVDTSLVSPVVALVGTNKNLVGNNYYEGVLDDFRIYNRALQQTEVQELYALGGTPDPVVVVPPPEPPPVVVTPPVGGTCTQVSQYGITWVFDKAYPCGIFANGDYWIVGPAVITQITPDFDGSKNGWEVNPAASGINSTMQQGFDSMTGGFNAALVPALPYIAQPNQSIVKSIHAACAPSCSQTTSVLQTAAVLTVLGSIPADNGTTVFRPPYVGTNKPLYRTTSLRTDLLPSLPPAGTPPSLDAIKTAFGKVQLDHYYYLSSSWRNLHPMDNMPDYGGDIGRRNGEILRLFLNDSISAKMPVLIAYTQYGIDLLHMSALGQSWYAGGSGHKPGQLLPLAFAAVLLNDASLRSLAQTATQRVEEGTVAYKNAAGVALFGQVEGTGPTAERYYWLTVANGDGFKSRKDPYQYVDGGPVPGTSYQSIITPVFRHEVLAFDLIPELKTVWHSPDFFEYVHRSIDVGTWSQPDPCAPYDGNFANYGITFGPNGNGGCILDTNSADGVGRFPARQGLQFYSVAYKTAFQDAMWTAYQVKWQGSYSGTSGTTPPPTSYMQGDFNKDGIVNSVDFSLLAGAWNTNNATYDLRPDGTVNTLDYSIMVQNWTR